MTVNDENGNGDEGVGFEPIAKLSREARASAVGLDRTEARDLVETYYRWQGHRIALRAQQRELVASGRSAALVAHLAEQVEVLEKQMTSALKAWVEARPEGRWALDQKGIGPVLAAGLSAHVDIARTPTVGNLWSFAGLNPNTVWLGAVKAAAMVREVLPAGVRVVTPAQLDEVAARVNRKPDALLRAAITSAKFRRDDDDDNGNDAPVEVADDITITPKMLERALAFRPYNADLKVLCWKIGDSFVKQSNRHDAYYGSIYRRRKTQEVERNDARAFADQAAATLRDRRIVDKTLRATYEDGKLPAGRLDLRARRYAVKLFLAHWWTVAYVAHFHTEPPAPYPIAYLGHAHVIEVPPGGDR
jgi:hypothetical protein